MLENLSLSEKALFLLFPKTAAFLHVFKLALNGMYKFCPSPLFYLFLSRLSVEKPVSILKREQSDANK